MSAKSKNSSAASIDADDAPELTPQQFEQGVWRIGDITVSRSEAQIEMARRRVEVFGGSR